MSTKAETAPHREAHAATFAFLAGRSVLAAPVARWAGTTELTFPVIGRSFVPPARFSSYKLCSSS